MVLTLSEAAAVVRCSKAHLCNILNRRVPGVPELPHLVLGRRKLIRRCSLDRWLADVEAERL